MIDAHKLRQFTVAVLLLSSIASPVVSQEQAVTPSQPRSETTEAKKVFRNLDEVMREAKRNKQIYVVERDEYLGASLLPFGSKAKALAEAQEKAGKSRYGSFLIVRDQEQQMTNWYGSGIHRVIVLRAVSFQAATPEYVMKLADGGASAEIASQLSAFFWEPEYGEYIPQFKEMIRAGAAIGDGSFLPVLVAVVAKNEGKVAVDDLKRWAKYHKGDGVRSASYSALLDLGEVNDVEEAIKSEENKATKMRIEDKIRKIRIGG